MNTHVTAEQIAFYQDNGFLILENFLSPQEVEEIIAAVSEAVRQMGRQKVAGEGNKDLVEGESFYDKVFVQRLNLWKINPTIKKYFLSPELGRMLCQLTGAPGIRVWHDQTLQKQPWANPTAWHLDNPYWSFHSRQAISIWVALDEATLQNGCLYYLPGSHKLARYDNVDIGQNMDALFQFYPEFRTLEPVAAPMKPGDAGLHNGLTAHAAGPNMTPRWRRAMTCAYMPEGATFNGIQNILSQEQVARLKIGDPLNDDSQNPLLWPKK
ncbi:MAG: phytanoyl-CoA dioxygenase family protein [candidate division KSB1 bacterium]|nr:phytanoyl-CoA dioxygenase family protein [candidate division KSB1 bacterium]MDZ7276317.1 phytanoyl-CoA dioxygenase family protein [candidate division KSB1 bacterium]MDZ7287730.1 phytanoyl-CoA dioxygenase family protein [candidate division KSB1 bacterium]MDZ7299930.1 phytanoyl-CoA dioxygenase family protein [candidate division KSB1 bacterium]MDZ7305741.1 phytanoyl-CoA dioxygenase family protein [candidate division KSB1 bacterium]